MKNFEVGDRVRLIKKQVYKNSIQDYLKVGAISEIIELGNSGTFSSYAEQLLHVQVKEEGPDGQTSWVQIDCLEPVNDEAAFQEALNSIQQAADPVNHGLIFDEIVFRDSADNRYVLRPHGRSILITNEKGEFEILLDRHTWINLSGLAELALTAGES